MVLLHLQCPSGAPLRYAVCHAACSSSSFLTAATVSFTPLRSFLPSFRFITARSQLNHLLQGRASQATHKAIHMRCTCLSASHPYNTHWVSFRFTTSFIHFSSVQSTRCPLFFCSPAAPLKAAFTLRLLIAHVVPPFRKASLRFTCIVQPPPYPAGNLLRRLPMELASPFVPHGFSASPFVGARCPPPFIRSSFSPAAI